MPNIAVGPLRRKQELEPEVQQSGFGVNFLFWPGEFVGIFSANFDGAF